MPNNVEAGSLITWTHVPDASGSRACFCAPPNSFDAGLKAVWDLGSNSAHSTQGFEVTFLAQKPGRYEVSMQVFDHFGNRYVSSAKVEVH